MTKEEFLEGIKDMVADFDNPNGEIHGIKAEFEELAVEVGEHDPLLVGKFRAVVTAIEDIGSYVKSRA
jgi:hypothetical protein